MALTSDPKLVPTIVRKPPEVDGVEGIDVMLGAAYLYQNQRALAVKHAYIQTHTSAHKLISDTRKRLLCYFADQQQLLHCVQLQSH